MKLQDRVLQVVDKYKGYSPSSGGCLKMFLRLKKEFPQAIGYYNQGHVVTKVGTKFYDKFGVYDKLPESDIPFTTLNSNGLCYFKSSFRDLLNKYEVSLLNKFVK